MDQKEEWPWAQAWLRNESLEALNSRIHGRDTVEKLYEGAQGLHETAVGLWPEVAPKEGDRVLDFGSGVGWPMQVGMDLFPGCHFTGLDISQPMVGRAKERLAGLANAADYEGRYDFQLYDGTNFPFEDDTFDIIYSFRVLWHIPEHYLFPILKEMARVLKPGGSVVVNFLPFIKMTEERMLAQCQIQKESQDAHYLYYHTYQKIHWWICTLLSCTDLEIRDLGDRIWVCFSKGGAQPVRDENFAKILLWLERKAAAKPSELTKIVTKIPALASQLEGNKERIAKLQATAAKRGERIKALQATVAKRGERIAKLQGTVAERIEQIGMLEGAVAERDKRVAELEAEEAGRRKQIGDLKWAVDARNKRIAALEEKVGERRGRVSVVERNLTERIERIATLEETVARRGKRIVFLEGTLTEYDEQVTTLRARLALREEQAEDLLAIVEERDRQIAAIYDSGFRRIAKPLRGISSAFRAKMRKLWRQPAV